jgi:hypothetical protein
MGRGSLLNERQLGVASDQAMNFPRTEMLKTVRNSKGGLGRKATRRKASEIESSRIDHLPAKHLILLAFAISLGRIAKYLPEGNGQQ